MARLREVYPNMMELQFARHHGGKAAARAGGDHRQRQPDDLFRAFYRDMLGEEIGDAALEVFNDAAQALGGSDDEGRGMKPLIVDMQAFGPFAHQQVIDFRELGSKTFFLIHGPTGSGKTSILDGICFALFGDSSGGEREGRHLRSHHADSDTLTRGQLRLCARYRPLPRPPRARTDAQVHGAAVARRSRSRPPNSGASVGAGKETSNRSPPAGARSPMPSSDSSASRAAVPSGHHAAAGQVLRVPEEQLAGAREDPADPLWHRALQAHRGAAEALGERGLAREPRRSARSARPCSTRPRQRARRRWNCADSSRATISMNARAPSRAAPAALAAEGTGRGAPIRRPLRRVRWRGHCAADPSRRATRLGWPTNAACERSPGRVDPTLR